MKLNLLVQQLLSVDGYGRFGTYLARALVSEGVDLAVHAFDMLDCPPDLLKLQRVDLSQPSVALGPVDRYVSIPRLTSPIGFTMTENDGAPDGWPEAVNFMCRELIVPSEFNREGFYQAGVRVPISVVPGGTDPDDFPLVDWSTRPDRPFTYLCLGDRAERKGMFDVIEAFKLLFPRGGEFVKLIVKVRVKSWPGVSDQSFGDPRIVLDRSDPNGSLTEVYRQCDAFVFPSYAEGWGMPPRETAMMGIPTIATKYSGLEEGIDHWGIPLTRFTVIPARLTGSSRGNWAKPSLDELQEKMWDVYSRVDEARTFAQSARDWLIQNQSWQRSAQQLIAVVLDSFRPKNYFVDWSHLVERVY